MEAIYLDSAEAVALAVRQDPAALCGRPDLADPPTLIAVRGCCSPGVLAVLLRSGAYVDAVGAQNLTALESVSRFALVYTPGARGLFMPDELRDERCYLCALWLLGFGADWKRVDEQGKSSADRAEMFGRLRLAHLLRHWGGGDVASLVAACTSLARVRDGENSRANAGSAPQLTVGGVHACCCILCLPGELLECICTMLAPMPAGCRRSYARRTFRP